MTAPAEERTFHPLEYWKIIRRRRWAVVACLVVVLGAVVLRTVLTRPTYRATAQLQIERENPSILPFKEIFSGGSQFDDFYETQYQLMKSRNVARRVLVAIGDVLPAPAVLSPAARDREVGGADSPAEIQRIDAVLAAVQIEPIKNSRLVNIHAVATNPERAARLANAVADCYVSFIKEVKFSTTDAATEGMGTQIQQLDSALARMEEEIQQYVIRNDVIALSDKSNATLQRFDDLNSDYTRAISARIDAESRWRSLESAAPESFGEVLQSPLIKDLQNNVSRLEGEYEQLSRVFKPGWPALDRKSAELGAARKMLDGERGAIVTRVRAAAHKDYRTADARAESLKQEVERQKKEMQALNEKKFGYDRLKAELDSKRQIYSDLVTRQNQTGVTRGVEGARGIEGTASGNVRIVDRAEVPTRIYKPNRLLNVLLGIALGLTFGVGAAFVLESVDNTVKTIDDLQAILEKPALGVIPYLGEGLSVPAADGKGGVDPITSIESAARDPRCPAAEAFRELRTSILLSSPNAPPRSLLITSSRPGEGKTATAFNVAAALAQIDRRVLLIDCDLRRPRVHRVLGMRECVGLSNYLSSSEMPLSAIVKATDVPGLSVVLSGPIPPNPAELLASERFERLMDAATSVEGFDHVILDSSPLLSVADPVILASRVSAVILVIDAGGTPKGALLRAREKLAQGKITLLGGVLNKVDRGADGYGEYGYRYGQYRYEYAEGRYTETARRARRARPARKTGAA